jgi:hypothetical protein
MTTTETHTAFKIELDKSEVTSYPSFLPVEIDYWLNKSYLMVINQKMSGNNALKQGFEKSQKRVSDLAGLLVSSSIATMTCASSPSTGTAQTDILYFVNGDLSYKNSAGGTTTGSTVIPITHEESDMFKKTDTNNPIINTPVMVRDSYGFKIYYDETKVFPLSTTVITFTYNYIKRPTKIDIVNSPNSTMEVNESVQMEVVSLAVLLAIENIESSRMSTNSSTLNIQE